METIKSVLGYSTTNEDQAGTEPVSGQKGAGNVAEPYDAGNQVDNAELGGSAPQNTSSTTGHSAVSSAGVGHATPATTTSGEHSTSSGTGLGSGLGSSSGTGSGLGSGTESGSVTGSGTGPGSDWARRTAGIALSAPYEDQEFADDGHPTSHHTHTGETSAIGASTSGNAAGQSYGSNISSSTARDTAQSSDTRGQLNIIDPSREARSSSSTGPTTSERTAMGGTGLSSGQTSSLGSSSATDPSAITGSSSSTNRGTSGSTGMGGTTSSTGPASYGSSGLGGTSSSGGIGSHGKSSHHNEHSVGGTSASTGGPGAGTTGAAAHVIGGVGDSTHAGATHHGGHHSSSSGGHGGANTNKSLPDTPAGYGEDDYEDEVDASGNATGKKTLSQRIKDKLRM